MQESDEPEKAIEKQDEQSDIAQNGTEPPVADTPVADPPAADPPAADKDVVMTEADIGDEMTIDMEAFEDIVKPSETNSEPSANDA